MLNPIDSSICFTAWTWPWHPNFVSSTYLVACIEPERLSDCLTRSHYLLPLSHYCWSIRCQCSASLFTIIVSRFASAVFWIWGDPLWLGRHSNSMEGGLHYLCESSFSLNCRGQLIHIVYIEASLLTLEFRLDLRVGLITISRESRRNGWKVMRMEVLCVP